MVRVRRNVRRDQSNISIDGGGPPGCMWSVLHVLQYNHWHFIKKRLPYKKSTSAGHARGEGNRRGPVIAVDDEETSPDNSFRNSKETPPGHNVLINKSAVQDTRKRSSATSKGTVKSRIKSLFGDELYKKKGKHQRSSTAPVWSHLTRMDSMHHLDILSENVHADANFNDESPTTTRKGTSLLPSSVVKLTSNSFEHLNENESSTTASSGPLENNEVDETGNQVIVDGRNTDTANDPSKEIMDAQDMINMDKEVFYKCLQDPKSHLASHFHNQRVWNTKKGYSKSASFPSSGSSRRRSYEAGKLQQNQEDMESHGNEEKMQARQYNRSLTMSSLPATHNPDGVLKLKTAMAELFPNSSSGSAHHSRKQGQNEVVMKRFNDLKQKITHVIKERKEEKHRIAMDGILHKVPQGYKYSEMKKSVDIVSHGKDSSSNYDSHSRKREDASMSKALSLSRSLNRYLQLYKSNFKKEAEPQKSKTLKLTPDYVVSPPVGASKPMSRILSLPNLKSYRSHSCESPEFFSSSQVRAIEEGSNTERDDFTPQMSPDYSVSSEHRSQLDTKYYIRSDFPEYFNGDKYSLTDDKLSKESITELEEPSPLHASNHEFPVNTWSFQSCSSYGDSEILHILPNTIDALEHQLADSGMISPPPAKHEVINEKTKALQESSDRDTQQCQVNAKDKAEFGYVRDILELSGFSGNELLGAWHSDDQPLDPLVFEEMEGCMLLDPDCTVAIEGGNFYHQLLFDLINEVLMDIYSKSYSYYPLPLCCSSRIRPMPVGQHVLEEVWGSINWHLGTSVPDPDQLLDYVASRDLAKSDWWMNLQFDAECVGMELEDMIFSDLLDELVFS